MQGVAQRVCGAEGGPGVEGGAGRGGWGRGGVGQAGWRGEGGVAWGGRGAPCGEESLCVAVPRRRLDAVVEAAEGERGVVEVEHLASGRKAR